MGMRPDNEIITRSFALLESLLGRRLLAKGATWHARRVSGRDIRVFFDEFWMHRVDGVAWVDSSSFAYRRWIAAKWLERADSQERLGRDCWFHRYEPRRGDTIVDVGAGTGTDLPLFSSQVGPEGRVVAVEANPTTFAMAERAVAANSLTNVTCLHRAIIDEPARVSITDDERRDRNSIELAGAAPPPGSLEVDGCTLAALCDECGIERIELLKMNIEGAERYAILGMNDVLPRIRSVCIACHDFRADEGDGEGFRTRRIVTEFLADHGFEITTREADERPAVRDHIHGWNRNAALG